MNRQELKYAIAPIQRHYWDLVSTVAGLLCTITLAYLAIKSAFAYFR